MTSQDYVVLSPLLVLAVSSVLIMLLIAFRLSHRIIQIASLLLYVISLTAVISIRSLPYRIEPLFVIDGFAILAIALIIFSSLVVNILSYIYFDEKEESPKEYYVLLFLASLGSCVLAISKHFISLFLGLELLSVALYALIAYLRGRHQPIEAGIKYLVLAAFSSAFLLFGMALIYFETGKMDLSALKLLNMPVSGLFLTGIILMLTGIGFKLAIVPFHMWTADIYQGAPPPVTAFIATASKGGVFVAVFRLFAAINALESPIVLTSLLGISIASMLVGNLLALKQENVKRILAYSSIAHLGYLLLALIPMSRLGTRAIIFYLLTYILSTLSAFGVVTLLSSKDTDAENIRHYQGLFWSRPILAVILTAAMLSLAGIPVTAGFIGKFYILATGINSGYWVAAMILVLGSVIGLYYYLRIITVMFSGLSIRQTISTKSHPFFYLLSSLVLSVLAGMILWYGIYPSALLEFIETYMSR